MNFEEARERKTVGLECIKRFLQQLPEMDGIEFECFEFLEDEVQDCFFLNVFLNGIKLPAIRIETEWAMSYPRLMSVKSDLDRYLRKELRVRIKGY